MADTDPIEGEYDYIVEASASLGIYCDLLIVYLTWGSAYLVVKVCVFGLAIVTPLQLPTGRVATYAQ
ncbi:hypothetical protein SAMN05519103_09197 [Rhizobiales bacterium GAS113]|nr:hypothetical protein SAMN05519103_09197 [Rhizobiales bacterium GAS113]